MEIVFETPLYLWFLLVVPLIIIAHYFSLRYSRKRAVKFANFIALARVSEKVGISSNNFILFLRVIVFVSVIFAISGTSVWYSGTQIDADYIVVIDSSSSMLADDFFPTRFDAAKDAAKKFTDKLPIYSSIGIIGFSGTSYVAQPLTQDKQSLRRAVDNLDIMKSGGTDIGGAIITATNLLISSSKPRVVILITDGRSNVGFEVGQAISYANNNRIIVNTIGVGTEEGYFLEVDEQLGPLGVDTKELELIASSTGGEFYHPETIAELNKIYEGISKVEKSKVSLDLTFFLLVFILAILFVEWILINTKFRIIP